MNVVCTNCKCRLDYPNALFVEIALCERRYDEEGPISNIPEGSMVLCLTCYDDTWRLEGVSKRTCSTARSEKGGPR